MASEKESEEFRVIFSVLDQTTPPQVDCSWCGANIRPGREPVSHGICPACAKEHFPKLGDRKE